MMTIEIVPLDEACEWISHSATDVFKTMFDLAIERVDPKTLGLFGQEVIVGSVGFAGEATGVVFIYVASSLARQLTSHMLGIPEPKITSDELVNDVIGEVANMVVGSVKGRFCDAGAPCVLTIPSIVRGSNFSIEPTGGANRGALGFRVGLDHIIMELITK